VAFRRSARPRLGVTDDVAGCREDHGELAARNVLDLAERVRAEGERLVDGLALGLEAPVSAAGILMSVHTV